jgi:hypothetical protein
MWATIEHKRMPEKTLNSFEVIGEAIGGQCGGGKLSDRFSTRLRFQIP